MILVIFSNLHDSMTSVIMFPSKVIHAVHEAQPCSRPSGREQCGISGGEERMCHWNARSIPLLGGNAQVLRPWELDIGVKTRRDQSHACNLPSFLNCSLYETVSARAWHLLSAVPITVLNQGQQINTVGLKDLVVCGELSVSTWEYLWMCCGEETVIDTRLEGRKTPFGNPGSNPAWHRVFFSMCADAGKAELVSSLLTPLPPLQGNTLRKNRIYIARRETVESNGLLSPESKQETSGFPCM